MTPAEIRMAVAHWPGDLPEVWAERSAIIEFGHSYMTRDEAERLAFLQMGGRIPARQTAMDLGAK